MTGNTPALLTRIVAPPIRSVSAATRAQSASSVMSAVTATYAPPAASTASRVASWSAMSTPTTCVAPSAASEAQKARPRPPAAPVTTATRPPTLPGMAPPSRGPRPGPSLVTGRRPGARRTFHQPERVEEAGRCDSLTRSSRSSTTRASTSSSGTRARPTPVRRRTRGRRTVPVRPGDARRAGRGDGRRLRTRGRPAGVREPARGGRHRQRADRDAQRPSLPDAAGRGCRAAGLPPPDPGPDALGRPGRAGPRRDEVGGGGPPRGRGSRAPAPGVPGRGDAARGAGLPLGPDGPVRRAAPRRLPRAHAARADGDGAGPVPCGEAAALGVRTGGGGRRRGRPLGRARRGRARGPLARRRGLPRADERPPRLPDDPRGVPRHAPAGERGDPEGARPARRRPARRRAGLRPAPLHRRCGGRPGHHPGPGRRRRCSDRSHLPGCGRSGR